MRKLVEEAQALEVLLVQSIVDILREVSLHLPGSQHGFQVDSYEDEAVGTMSKNEKGVLWISDIELNPRILYSGDVLPKPEDEGNLHHLSHEQCFIANSIKTNIHIGTNH